MRNNKPKPEDISMRNKAEEKLKNQEIASNIIPSQLETLKLLHELQVHQIELEMMNEELQKARDIAEATSEKYIELYDFAPTGYLILFYDGSIIQLNFSVSKMLNVERSLIINRDFRYFLSQDSKYIFDEFIRKVFELKVKVSCELTLRTENNPTLTVYVEGILDKNGDKCNMTLVDITKQKQIENELKIVMDELKRSNSELTQFAYVASHDIQEPLRMMSSYAGLLSVQYKDRLDTKANEYISFITDGAKRMQTLIRDLLLYSRVTSQKISFEKTNLNTIMENVLSDYSLAIQENEAEITVGYLPEILADKTQIKQLFQNLIANALKFRNDKKPEIEVSAKAQDGKWFLSVKDNGIGIESQFFEQIFRPFERLNDRDKYPGNGIGLAVCKKIVEHHGGILWVESEPGIGTTFHFTIPYK